LKLISYDRENSSRDYKGIEYLLAQCSLNAVIVSFLLGSYVYETSTAGLELFTKIKYAVIVFRSLWGIGKEHVKNGSNVIDSRLQSGQVTLDLNCPCI